MEIRSIVLGVFLFLCHAMVFGEGMTFRVIAIDGSPIKHAVVTSGDQLDDSDPEVTVMDQIDKSFAPHVVVVPKGADVSFPNSDQVRHHVYSFSDARPFELRLYSGVPKSPVEFDQEGVVVVGCNIHDNMLGYIYVSDRPAWGISDDNGDLSLPVSDAAVYVWHAALSLDAQEEMKFNLADLQPDAEGHLVIQLPIDPPDPDPQTIKKTGGDKFQRYLDL